MTKAVLAQRGGQQPDERGTISPVQPGLTVGSAQHGNVVAQDEQLDMLRCRGLAEQPQPAENPDEDQVKQTQRHDARFWSHRSPRSPKSRLRPTSGTQQAALDADEALRRDSRPMVLYLRTFADDSLTIRTATYARRSFLDRLSPRRFERFEEVLVRNLTMIGPVVALNPPGTDLAPIGAARETLASDHWQSTITGWMTPGSLWWGPHPRP